MNSFDLSIFKDEDYSYKCDASNYSKCIAMKRLIHGMKYYSSLNIVNNEKHQEIFVHFMVEVYGAFNDDYIHFQENHQNELEQIYNDLINKKQFKKCGINQCKYTQRHHAITHNDDDALLDPKLTFYKEMMDALHFHLFHCFDAGLRTLKHTDDDEDDDHSEEQKGSDYFDAEFARMHRSILKGESNTKSLDRFSPKNTKFNILTENKSDNIDRVYCDELLKHLLKFEVDNMDGMKALYALMQSEEYDTDAVQCDVSLKANGNIIKNIKKKTFKNIYIEFVKTTKISARSFSIGFRFYYWIYYKNIKKLEEDDYNINDHSGFDVKQLFVSAKYDSLKEEIINNKYIIIKQYQQVIIKINAFKQSARFKKITATRHGTAYHHYEIKRGDVLGFDQLLSLVFYTDYSDLSTDFSSTFRRKNIFEPLQSVIKRNMEYYWMSKALRECVEVFGQCYEDKERWNKDYMRGPFYCGMNIAMNMNSFNLRLCSPSSTSKQIEVAMKFSGTHGMVLQLHNPYQQQYVYLHGFNASWISKYKEEDERLFFGGAHFIKVESVRIRATQKNYEKFIYSIYYLDTMVTGSEDTRSLEVSADDVFILSNFMNKLLNKNNQITKTFDHYLYETFTAFVLNKTQIVLDLLWLSRIKDSGIRDLLMNDMEKREYDEEKRRENKDITNLFKAELLEIFKNVKNIIIKTGYGSVSFSFSMFGLLSLIESGSVEHVVIKHIKNETIKYQWKKMHMKLLCLSSIKKNKT